MLPLTDLTVCEGDIAQLEVRFSQENVEGTWMKNGQAVSPSDRVHIVIDKQVHKLLLENVSTEDAASYSFVVPAQDISTSGKLSIQSKCVCYYCHFLSEAPRSLTSTPVPAAIDIVVPLKDLSTIEGTKAVLEAKISAQDISSVKWYHNNKQVTPSDRIQTVAKGAKQRLVFSRTHGSDQGQYKLVVGKVDTSCTLTVESKSCFQFFLQVLLSAFVETVLPLYRGPHCETHGGQSVLRVPEGHLQGGSFPRWN